MRRNGPTSTSRASGASWSSTSSASAHQTASSRIADKSRSVMPWTPSQVSANQRTPVMSRSLACYQGRQIHATHGPRTGAILGVVYSRELFWPPGCTIS